MPGAPLHAHLSHQTVNFVDPNVFETANAGFAQAMYEEYLQDPAAVGNGLAAIAPQAEAQGSVHPDVLAALGGLYADTISHLRPRIMVQGNPHYLGQAGVVSEIRALLLAAVRSAMLWRQLGGSQWQFLFARRAMVDAVGRQLR